MKKKILSITLILILSVLSFGCTSESNTNSEETYVKGTYNIAYINIYFYTEKDKINDEYQMSLNPEYHGDIYRLQNYSSGDISSTTLQMSYYCYITDWEYGKNDTIILYLTDGRTLQTSTNNVLLMYEPDIK